MTDTREPNLADHGKIALEGLHNTRDLGGLPAGTGHVLPRRLLRSGMLAPATAGDLATLRAASCSASSSQRRARVLLA